MSCIEDITVAIMRMPVILGQIKGEKLISFCGPIDFPPLGTQTETLQVASELLEIVFILLLISFLCLPLFSPVFPLTYWK